MLSHMPRTVAVEAAPRLRPFLKWAGGKRQLLRDLRRFVPPAFGDYHEPFLGSGAVFFDLWRRERLRGRACTLTDLNSDLIGSCAALARDVDGVIVELRRLAAVHERRGEAAYYRVRDERFNPERRRRSRDTAATGYPLGLAAMFIYLNRTGYNGLFRLNARGDFNVPAGRYDAPRICDEPMLRLAAAVLADPLVTLGVEPFMAVESRARAGDLVYLDPPYAPLSVTARFTSYTPGSFSADDQARLQQVVLALADKGCFVVLSNSTAPLVTELYCSRAARAAGLRAHRIPARRAINSQASGRGAVEEYIISNVDPQ